MLINIIICVALKSDIGTRISFSSSDFHLTNITAVCKPPIDAIDPHPYCTYTIILCQSRILICINDYYYYYALTYTYASSVHCASCLHIILFDLQVFISIDDCSNGQRCSFPVVDTVIDMLRAMRIIASMTA